MENVRQLTPEETAKLYKLREPTAQELVVLAHKCGKHVKVAPDGFCVMEDFHTWHPGFKADQNAELLAAVIAQGDCRLFYDQEINEFFIYQYNGEDTNPPLAHSSSMYAAVLEAALNLWCPED